MVSREVSSRRRSSPGEPAPAQAWPAKPIRMIVPLAPGATADIVARLFADELGKALGQTVVVDNKTGAGGTIATAETGACGAGRLHDRAWSRRARMVFNIGLYKTPGYDPLKDLALIAVSGGVSNVLIVHPTIRQRPWPMCWRRRAPSPASTPIRRAASAPAITCRACCSSCAPGVKLQHVPYRATPAGIQAVVNGEVQMGLFNMPTVIGLIRAAS